MKNYDIFLSHSSQDKTYVNLLQKRLIGKYRVWYDETNILWGNNLQETIEEGLKYSYYGIAVLSHHYLALRRWTAFEFERIINSGKIFPLLHNITIDEIKKKYPDVYEHIKEIRIISSEPGLDYVLDQVNKIIGDSIIDQKQEFATLRDLLVEKDWTAADRETYKLINQKCGLLKFPHEDLNRINCLWSIYSDDRHGFSIQKRIYLKVLEQQNQKYLNAFEKFVVEVKWIRGEDYKLSSDPTPNITTPKGHFPMLVYSTGNLKKKGPPLSHGHDKYVGCLSTCLSNIGMLVVLLVVSIPFTILIIPMILSIPVIHRITDLRMARQLHKFFSTINF